MSMDRCHKCSELVDTDFDCSFYDFSYLVKDLGGHCEHCRDEITERMTPEAIAAHEKRIYG